MVPKVPGKPGHWLGLGAWGPLGHSKTDRTAVLISVHPRVSSYWVPAHTRQAVFQTAPGVTWISTRTVPHAFHGLALVLMAFPRMSVPASLRRELRLRDIEELAQGCTASQ